MSYQTRGQATDAGWETVAAYRVEVQRREQSPGVYVYRTRAVYDEGRDRRAWHGLQVNAAARWLQQHFRGLQLVSEPATTEPETLVQIARVLVFQPAAAGKPQVICEGRQAVCGVIQAGRMFRLQVQFVTSDLSAHHPHSYNAQLYAYNRDTAGLRQLGTSTLQPYLEGAEAYSLTLDGVQLDAGNYRIEVVVRIHCDTRPMIGYVEVPVLQVI